MLTKKLLLPAPYYTDCIDYTKTKSFNNWPKSQSYCKLEYMRRKELEICGKNYYWIQYPFDDKNQKLNFSQTTVNCTVKPDQILLDKLCRPHCETKFSLSLL